MRFNRSHRRRIAISEVIGSLLSITVTIIAGAAVFGYVNNQAGVSERVYATSVGTTNNFLAETFKIVDVYFPSTTQVGVLAYNIGNTNFQVSSIILYDSSGQMNILYNYTGSVTKTDHVYDLKAGSQYYYGACRLGGTGHESPLLSTVDDIVQNTQLILLTIPPLTANCPSYGQTFTPGVTYYVRVTGMYGNVVTYYQVR